MNTRECKEAIIGKLIAEQDNILFDKTDPDIPKYFNISGWVRESKETDKRNQEIVRHFRNMVNYSLSAVVGTDMNGNLKYIDIEMD